MIRIKKGLDLPIDCEVKQEIEDGPASKTVALIGDDYIGMKPTMAVTVGDVVKLGQVLFTDKKNPGVRYTSPACGKVIAINRGAKRVFQSIVVEVDGDEEETFQAFESEDLTTLTREQVCDNLVESGLWTSFRTRPYSKIPCPSSAPHSIFVTAIDTNPLAPQPSGILKDYEREFVFGLRVVRHLTDGKLFLIKALGTVVPGTEVDGVTVEQFDGPHPAGLPGTHIHVLDPVGSNKTVWHINYQDVMAIGRLFITGRLSVERIISLAGPVVSNSRLIRTRIGTNVEDLTRDELAGDDYRLISGSVLSGRSMVGPFAFLGRFHLQVSALAEGRDREFLGWQRPGFDKFSIKPVFASAAVRGDRKYRFTTAMNGSRRAMVPIGCFEQVMPLDILPTFLLRALLVGDTEQAQALGCLELDEEDLALCTFVCPGKEEYGPLLRNSLTRIEQEG